MGLCEQVNLSHEKIFSNRLKLCAAAFDELFAYFADTQ